jgi:hypothetical protein
MCCDAINVWRLDNLVAVTTKMICPVLIIDEHQKIGLLSHHPSPRGCL